MPPRVVHTMIIKVRLFGERKKCPQTSILGRDIRCPGACPPPDKYRGRGPTATSYLREQMTQETLGGAGAKRSPPDTGYPSPIYEPIFYEPILYEPIFSWMSSVRLWMIS